MLRVILFALAVVFPAATPLSAQEQALQLGEWQFVKEGESGEVLIEEHLGVPALKLSRAVVGLDGVEFSEGVIEFDIAMQDRFGFGGLLWHRRDPMMAEYFYLRQHKSGQPDAGQYTPIRGGLTSWQIYTDRNGIAPFAFTQEGWNRVKVVSIGDRADIYMNGSTAPVMHIPDLASDGAVGGVGFINTGQQGLMHIANISIRPATPEDVIIGQAVSRDLPDGVIDQWTVSDPFAENQIANLMILPEELKSSRRWAGLNADRSGIADLSRVTQIDAGADTVLVETSINSAQARRVKMRFGYSDRLRLFLNGNLIFDGVAGWRTRDHQFLGTIGFSDAVVLELDQGENVLTAAVSETFGGWGFAGAIAERDGLILGMAN